MQFSGHSFTPARSRADSWRYRNSVSTTGPDCFAMGWSHARRFSRMGTSRRARVFEIFAPTWINHSARSTSFQSNALISATRRPAKSPMAWKAKDRHPLIRSGAPRPGPGSEYRQAFGSPSNVPVFLAIADVAHPRFSAKLQRFRMSRRNVFLLSGATFRLARKLSRSTVLICAMVFFSKAAQSRPSRLLKNWSFGGY
jgi:hypothetical protein